MARHVYRFAPSPNGALHPGHAFSALLNQALARRDGGRLLVRIEDIDTARCTPALEAAMLDDLAWIGLEWERPERRQSDHFETYRDALERLRREGLVYPAFLSRGEARAIVAEAETATKPWPRDPDGAPHYPGTDRRLADAIRRRRIAAGDRFAWRLDMQAALHRAGGGLSWREEGAGPSGETGTVLADPAAWGDVVLARRDIPASYHLCVVVDDALQQVSDVVRGRDLFHATSVHRLLQVLLGLPEPRYRHHGLLLGPDGRKLSKSAGSLSISALRAQGMTAADLRGRLDLEEAANGLPQNSVNRTFSDRCDS